MCSMSDTSYKTLKLGYVAEGLFEDRKSRFIAQLCHVKTEQEAREFLASVKAKHYNARHNVPAWILENGTERASDDGEPSRTAGMPVLEVLRGAGLKNVCCVVTRYFGGTLLGPGGLVRAYTTATQEALASAELEAAVQEMLQVVRIELSVPYNLYEQIQHLISDVGGKIITTEFGVDVFLAIDFRCGEEVPFTEALTELSAGKITAKISAARYDLF